MGVEHFAGRLKELREKAGLSQPALAEKAGMKLGGIADLEQGRRDPRWETVLALAAALGVDCTAFNVPPATPEAKLPAPEPEKPKRPVGRPMGSGKKKPKK